MKYKDYKIYSIDNYFIVEELKTNKKYGVKVLEDKSRTWAWKFNKKSITARGGIEEILKTLYENIQNNFANCWTDNFVRFTLESGQLF